MTSSNKDPTIQSLRLDNKNLTQQIKEATIKQNQLTQKLENDVNLFQETSKKTLTQMSEQILTESSQANTLLCDLTNKYEGVLKEQIKLLTENQKLTQQKDQEEEKFKVKINQISLQYQNKISDIQVQLKNNMSKVADLQGPGLIKILLKNQRFREQITKRGGNVDIILQKTEQQAIYKKITQKQQQIKSLQQSNEQIDQQVSKMSQMMQTFSQLLENMKLQRVNLQEQNKTLSEKLRDSKQMLNKIINSAKSS